MTVASFAVELTKFVSGICDCSVDSDAGTGEILLVPGALHVYRHAIARAPNMDYKCLWQGLFACGSIGIRLGAPLCAIMTCLPGL